MYHTSLKRQSGSSCKLDLRVVCKDLRATCKLLFVNRACQGALEQNTNNRVRRETLSSLYYGS